MYLRGVAHGVRRPRPADAPRDQVVLPEREHDADDEREQHLGTGAHDQHDQLAERREDLVPDLVHRDVQRSRAPASARSEPGRTSRRWRTRRARRPPSRCPAGAGCPRGAGPSSAMPSVSAERARTESGPRRRCRARGVDAPRRRTRPPQVDAEVAHADDGVDRPSPRRSSRRAGSNTESSSARWCLEPPFVARSETVVVLRPTRMSASRVTGMPWFATITMAFKSSPTKIRMKPAVAEVDEREHEQQHEREPRASQNPSAAT